MLMKELWKDRGQVEVGKGYQVNLTFLTRSFLPAISNIEWWVLVYHKWVMNGRRKVMPLLQPLRNTSHRMNASDVSLPSSHIFYFFAGHKMSANVSCWKCMSDRRGGCLHITFTDNWFALYFLSQWGSWHPENGFGVNGGNNMKMD